MLRGNTRTKEWQQDGIVERHDEEVDTGERSAGLQVAERVGSITVFAAAVHKHLGDRGEELALSGVS